MIKVKQTLFVTSAKNLAQCPPEDIAEIAFLGRSNVGKSTFINLMANNFKLAKSSATPGKTQLINFFETIWSVNQEIDFRFRFVDLPGFGYAKVSKTLKQEWEKDLWHFLNKRSSIKLFIHLVDSRHPQLDIDMRVAEALNSLCRGDQDVLRVYTKCDKLNANQRAMLARNGLLVSTNQDIIKNNQGGIERIKIEILKRVFGYEDRV